MEFHHLGLVTTDADQLARLLGAALDVPLVHSERFEGIEVRFLALGTGYLELLEPVQSGTLSRYLDRNGPGIHHIAVEPADLEGALDRAVEHGVELIDQSPRPGAWDHEVAFLHPDSTGGVLIEFVAPSSPRR